MPFHYRRDRAVDIVAASGTMRVTTRPKPTWTLQIMEALVIGFFVWFTYHGWFSMQLWLRVILVWAIVSSVTAWFYQFSGSEVIEFDREKLRVSKDLLGWNRVQEYPLSDCSELEWAEEKEGDYGLRCKVGWRTINFAEYVSEADAIAILTALQTNLPEVADVVCRSPNSAKRHFTTLDLNG